MKRILYSVVLVLGILISTISSLHATTVGFTISSLGGNTYEYTYTVINDTLASAIAEFTIFFDFGLYENLAVTTPAAGWDEITINPDLIFRVPDAGFYDAQALMAGIAPGATVSDFSVRFDWLGSVIPGAQSFEVIEPANLAILDAGTTSLEVVSAPEPETLLLLSTGVLTLAFFRIEVRRARQYIGYMRKRINSNWGKKSLSFSLIYFFILFLLCSFLSLPVLAQSSFLTIGNYTLVNEVRVGRTTYDYTFRADITNNGSRDAINVSAVLTNLVPTMTVIDGNLVFNTIHAGTTVSSTDTFTVRVDRRSPFNIADISWKIDGTNVVNPGGGVVSSPGGARLSLPPDSLAGATTVDLRDRALTDLNIPLPLGYTFLGAISIDIGSVQLAKEAVLEIPATQPANQVIVARVLRFGTTSLLTLVDTATFVESGFLRTNSPPFPGVHASGDYVFMAMPIGVGIVGTYVTAPPNTPVEGALVSVMLTSPGTQATFSDINQAYASLSAFVGQTDATGFAAVPGVLPFSDVVAVAFGPSQAELTQVSSVKISVGDILTGLPGSLIRQLMVEKLDIPNLPSIPPQCPCRVLTVNPLDMGIAPPLFTGHTQDIKTVYCGSKNVTSSAGSSNNISTLISGLFIHATAYLGWDPLIVTVSEKQTGGIAVAAVAPGSTKIDILTEMLSLFRFEGIILPNWCKAEGSVDPVNVRQQPHLTIQRIGSAANDGIVISVLDSRIDCGSTCQGDFNVGETVLLGAGVQPGTNAKFVEWGGDCTSCGTGISCPTQIKETDMTCTAEFDAATITPNFIIKISGSAWGRDASCTYGGCWAGSECGRAYQENDIATNECGGDLKINHTNSNNRLTSSYTGHLDFDGAIVVKDTIRRIDEKLDVYVLGAPGTTFTLNYEVTANVTADKTYEDTPECYLGTGPAWFSARLYSPFDLYAFTSSVGILSTYSNANKDTITGITSNEIINDMGKTYSFAASFSTGGEVRDGGYCVRLATGRAEFKMTRVITY